MTRFQPFLVLLGIAALIAAPIGQGNYIVYTLCSWLLFSIAAMGLNLTLGYAGQVSLAQAAFMGIGAYITALMTLAGIHWGVAVIVSIVSSFAVGLLLGYPALRVQHHYLAFVTLSFSTLAWLVFRNEEWLTKGAYGIFGIPRPTLLGLSFKTPFAFVYLSYVALALAALFLWWLVRSPWGRAFMALRENPLRALSLGVDTRRYTLMAFAIGSAMGGFAGALYAPLVEFIDPNPFTLGLSLNLLLMVIVGGAGFFFGPFLGALIAVLLPEWLRDYTFGMYLVAYALLVMALLIYSPTGILGILDRMLGERRTRAASAERAAQQARLDGAAGNATPGARPVP